jgi:Pyruvate/2-oxoacid:ferredoxin oxidoreductase gamma subunit
MLYYWGMVFYSDNSVFFGRLKKGCLKDYHRLEKLKSNAMKFYQLAVVAAIFLTACSPQKYTYHFDKYDYNVGRKTESPDARIAISDSPLKVESEDLLVSADAKTVSPGNNREVVRKEQAKSLTEKVKAMSRSERKEFRKELKKELKTLIKKDVKKTESVDSIERTKVFDTLAALALAFGVGGIVLITLANISNAFWIVGAIALAIGAFFFVKWVANGNG